MSDMVSKYFSVSELRCKVTGRCEMDPAFMERLDRLRERVNFPLIPTSGFRDPSHPEEAGKATGPGAHTLGLAVDLACSGNNSFRILEAALALGFTGIGLQQNLKLPPQKRYMHLDCAPSRDVAPRPSVWNY